MQEIEQTLRINQLYDYYGKLLTDKQQAYLEDYYRNDLSLQEIAQFYGVSRQAVYDNIIRSVKLLEHYEMVLGIQAQDEKRLKQTETLLAYIKQFYAEDTTLEAQVRALKEMDS